MGVCEITEDEEASGSEEVVNLREEALRITRVRIRLESVDTIEACLGELCVQKVGLDHVQDCGWLRDKIETGDAWSLRSWETREKRVSDCAGSASDVEGGVGWLELKVLSEKRDEMFNRFLGRNV